MKVGLGSIDINDKKHKAITRHLTEGKKGSLAKRADVREIFLKAGKKALKKITLEWENSD